MPGAIPAAVCMSSGAGGGDGGAGISAGSWCLGFPASQPARQNVTWSGGTPGGDAGKGKALPCL